MQETNKSFATMERRIPTYSPKAVRQYRDCQRVEQSQAWYPLVRCSGAFLLLSHSTRCRDVCSRTTVSGARTAFNVPPPELYRTLRGCRSFSSCCVMFSAYAPCGEARRPTRGGAIMGGVPGGSRLCSVAAQLLVPLPRRCDCALRGHIHQLRG